MANFLISTMPESGHVNPALPVAAALVRRGHSVLWHSGLGARRAIESTGATFIAFEQTPDFVQVPVRPDDGATGIAAGVSVMRRLFIDRVPGQVADYQRILERFPVDVILADMTSFGAATLHDLGGPPFATLGIIPLTTLDPEIPPWGSGRQVARSSGDRFRNRVAHWMARQLFLPKVTALLNLERTKLGLPTLPGATQFTDLQRSPFLHLMPTTPAFEYPRQRLAPQINFVGPLVPEPSADFELPVWWGDMNGRTVVHVTQGTYATEAASLIQPTIAALGESNVLVVVTTRQAERLGALPPNVRVAPFIPHSLLLPKAHAMITNGGYNGVLTALAHGVPLVCAGQSEDKAEVSARVGWSGAGIDLRTSTPSKQQVARAVARILSEPSFRQNAQRIAADFALHEGPNEAAELLERLAASGEPVLRREGVTEAVR